MHYFTCIFLNYMFYVAEIFTFFPAIYEKSSTLEGCQLTRLPRIPNIALWKKQI